MPGFHQYKYNNYRWEDQMKSKMLLISGLLSLTAGCATTATTTTAGNEHGHAMAAVAGQPKLYNETLNPRQIEQPDHLGFNDLHIQAIRHLVPDTHSAHDLNYKSLCIITAKPTMMAPLSA
jgi:hypothetical protein